MAQDAASTRDESKTLRIGLIYNLKRKAPVTEDDSEAEFDSPTTVDAIATALRGLGHEVELLEARNNLPAKLAEGTIDLAFNIAEGSGGRSREAVVPALLDLYDIEYTGSDATTLSLTLDKSLAKRIIAQAGLKTAPFLLMFTGKERLPKDLTFPVVCKPNAEGSSKGIFAGKSVARDEKELRDLVKPLLKRYSGGVLVESFLSGREFTVGLLGPNKKPRVLAPMEIVFLDKDNPTPIYTFEHKQADNQEVRYQAPAELDAKLKKKIETLASKSYQVLGCRDVSRIDVRLDASGEPCFIECNPLPGLSPDWSDLCIIARAEKMTYDELIAQIVTPAIKRLTARRRAK